MRSKPLRLVAIGLTLLIVVACLGAVYLTLDGLTDRATEGAADRTDLRAELTEQEAATTALIQQIEALGETPVVDPSTTSTPSTSGSSSPSMELLQSLIGMALVQQCGGSCAPEPPADPLPPLPPADPLPAIEPRDGTDGQDGETPSTDLLISLITPLIPAPIKGDTGASGPAGRGVSLVTCQEDGSWLITYTDGATQTTAGPCRVVATPDPIDPEPTPEPEAP